MNTDRFRYSCEQNFHKWIVKNLDNWPFMYEYMKEKIAIDREITGSPTDEEILFQRVTLKDDNSKGGFIDTPMNVWIYLIEDEEPERYDVTPVWMTQQQFDNLSDFTGF